MGERGRGEGKKKKKKMFGKDVVLVARLLACISPLAVSDNTRMARST